MSKAKAIGFGVGVAGAALAAQALKNHVKKKRYEEKVFDYKGKKIHSADVKYIPYSHLHHLKVISSAKDYDKAGGHYDLPYGPKRDKVFHFDKEANIYLEKIAELLDKEAGLLEGIKRVIGKKPAANMATPFNRVKGLIKHDGQGTLVGNKSKISKGPNRVKQKGAIEMHLPILHNAIEGFKKMGAMKVAGLLQHAVKEIKSAPKEYAAIGALGAGSAYKMDKTIKKENGGKKYGAKEVLKYQATHII